MPCAWKSRRVVPPNKAEVFQFCFQVERFSAPLRDCPKTVNKHVRIHPCDTHTQTRKILSQHVQSQKKKKYEKRKEGKADKTRKSLCKFCGIVRNSLCVESVRFVNSYVVRNI